ncbi:MAG: preprotein translocase subunit SecG [Candidatus Saccharibacteria bacterium]|nr:preprotein translocase subunit SecG [Candidatus Saccharibacteria bacterium]
MQLGSFLQATILVSAILTILLILLQQRGASLGAGFGSSGELYTTRRGLEKSLFITTIVFAVIFVASILALLIVPME